MGVIQLPLVTEHEVIRQIVRVVHGPGIVQVGVEEVVGSGEEIIIRVC
jgi:hypothetical protein